MRFMAACHAAELSYLDLFRAARIASGRHRQLSSRYGRGFLARGARLPWNSESLSASVPSTTGVAAESGGSGSTDSWAGKTLSDCIDKWIANRRTAKQAVREHHLNDMRKSIG
jgi:hypothetical protein